jgi:hypothetical protein
MPDDEMQDQPAIANQQVPFPQLEGERRKEQDRRSSERQGKYDRRRNRCAHCEHYKPSAKEDQGFCLFHKTAIMSYTFACPNFGANLPDQRK